MSERSFAVTWDYLCPFARNAHEHVIEGLRAGAPWDVSFVPFSLTAVHVPADEPPLWDRDGVLEESGILALLAGLAVRDGQPERFLAVHEGLFAARHDDGEDIRDEAVVRRVLESTGVDVDAAFAAVSDGSAMAALSKEHDAAVEDDGVFGVPTFLAEGEAVFVRLMDRPGGDGEAARQAIERVLDLTVDWTDLNEFKRTRIPR
jgi:hypothetical protein